MPTGQPTLGRLNSAADCLSIRAHYNARMSSHVGAWGPAKAYPNLDALREAYVLRAKAWEERQVGKAAPVSPGR
jgi:hypothetical protein